MNTINIFAYSICFLESFLFKIFLMIEYKFRTLIFIRKVTKPAYKETYHKQYIVYFLMVALFYAFAVCLIGTLFLGSPDYHYSLNIFLSPFIFIVTGSIIGDRYYKKIKIPFYKKYYPDEFDEYRRKNCRHRDYYLGNSFVMPFIIAFFGLGFVIGYISIFF